MLESIKCPLCGYKTVSDGTVIKCSNSESGSNHWRAAAVCELSRKWFTIEEWKVRGGKL